MSNYAIIPRLGVYYFAIQKKTKFVPLFKISRVNGTSPEEFHKLIEQLEIKQKNDTTRKQKQTDPRPNIEGTSSAWRNPDKRNWAVFRRGRVFKKRQT